MEGGVGAGAGSSERPQSSTPLPSNQAEDHAAPPRQVPATLYKKKVKWILDFFRAQNGGRFERSCVHDDLDTSRVKGEHTEGLFSGELDETDKETAARVEEEAFTAGHQDDALFSDDVLKAEVEKTTDAFVAESVQVAETLQQDVLCQEARPRRGKRKAESMLDLEEAAVLGMCNLESMADGEAELAEHVAPRATGETVKFGQHFSTVGTADAFCRSYHSPLMLMPGHAPGTRLFLCCAPSSAMPRRKLSSERKRSRVTNLEEAEILEGDLDEEVEEGEGEGEEEVEKRGKKGVKARVGARAGTYFNAEGCHGMVQVCAPADTHRALASRAHHTSTTHAVGAASQDGLFAARHKV